MWLLRWSNFYVFPFHDAFWTGVTYTLENTALVSILFTVSHFCNQRWNEHKPHTWWRCLNMNAAGRRRMQAEVDLWLYAWLRKQFCITCAWKRCDFLCRRAGGREVSRSIVCRPGRGGRRTGSVSGIAEAWAMVIFYFLRSSKFFFLLFLKFI